MSERENSVFPDTGNGCDRVANKALLLFSVVGVGFLVGLVFPSSTIAWVIFGIYTLFVFYQIVFQKNVLSWIAAGPIRERGYQVRRLLNGSRQGVQAWNQWRGENLGVKVDLRHLPLVEHDFSGADLPNVDLGNTNLTNANLTNANLNGARLESANLSGAILRGANLSNVNLSVATLDVADFSGADLTNVDFTGTDLSVARGFTDEQLSKVASLYYAIMPDGSRRYS